MDFNNIIIKNIKYNKPISINGKQIAETSYNNKNLIIETPVLLTKSSVYNNKRNYIYIELNKSNKLFFNLLTEIEENAVQEVYNNCESWFGKQIPIDVLDDYHNQFIKISSKNPKIKIYLDSKINTENLKKNILIKMKLKYLGLKFLKQQFTSEWLMTEYKIYDNIDNDSDIDFEISNTDILYNNYVNESEKIEEPIKNDLVDLDETIVDNDCEKYGISDEKLEIELKKILKKHKKKKYKIKLLNGDYKLL